MTSRLGLSALIAGISVAFSAQAGIVNGDFESGPTAGPPTGWTDTDSLLGYSRCSLAGCGDGGGSVGPASDSYWIWFGGSAGAQTAVLSQTALIESSAGALLFDFWAGETGAPDTTLTFSIDGTPEWTVTSASASAYAAGYQTVSIALGAFADGGTHRITWDYSDTEDAVNNWNLDHVRVAAAVSAVPEPASLALVGVALAGACLSRRKKAD